MAKAIILGSGTSNGIPTLGKNYDQCYLNQTKNHRTRSSLLLKGEGGNVLVDCGPEGRLQLLREGVTDIESVIITHTHADHVMGMDDLRSFCLKYKRPMTVYALPQYQEDIRRIFSYAFADFPEGIWVPRLELQDVPKLIEVVGLRIQTFIVEHGPWPVVALRVNNFAYLTDVGKIPEAAWPYLEGLDTLVLDAVRIQPHPNHFHFEKALNVAKEIGAKQTYLTHLSDDFDHNETNQALPAGIQLAFDGLQIPI